MKTSPLAIEIALYYWTHPGDYRAGDFSASAVQQTIDDFVEAGLLTTERSDHHWDARFYTTDGMEAYIEALRSVPLPIQIWVIPNDPNADLHSGENSGN